MDNFPIMTPTRAGLPNSCSECGQPVQEKHWMAEHIDAARSGAGVCVRCYVDIKAQHELAEAAQNANLQPNEGQQLIGQIPDEDLLVTGAALRAENSDTEEPVTDAAAPGTNVVTKRNTRRKKS